MDHANLNPDPEPLRSVHTASFPQLLQELGCSLLVTTYQAGKLIALRGDGGVLKTPFRVFEKPMGLAADARRFASGRAHQFHSLR